MLNIIELCQELHRLLGTMSQNLFCLNQPPFSKHPAPVGQHWVLHMKDIELPPPQLRPQSPPEGELFPTVCTLQAPAPGEAGKAVAELLSFWVAAAETGEDLNVTVDGMGQGCASEERHGEVRC